MRVLFVCGGNTCRSPMAAGIAQKVLGPSIQVESAGIAPHGTSATKDAIAVVRDGFDVDISGHQPSAVDPDCLNTYDCVVAMDPYVAERLGHEYRIPAYRLVEWTINDPYLKGRKVYEERAREIARALADLKQRLAGLGMRTSEPRLPMRHKLALAPSKLRADVKRWKAELAAGEIRDTLLQGIVKKAVDSFEDAFRRSVKALGALAGEVEASGKPFERLTFGELIEYLAQRDSTLTAVCRRSTQDTQLLKNRRLLSAPLRRLLDKISVMRNQLHHRPNEFASDLRTLHENSQCLLALLGEALDDAFFIFVERELTPSED